MALLVERLFLFCVSVSIDVAGQEIVFKIKMLVRGQHNVVTFAAHIFSRQLSKRQPLTDSCFYCSVFSPLAIVHGCVIRRPL